MPTPGRDASFRRLPLSGKPLDMKRPVFFLAAVLVAASACVGGSKGLSSEDKERLKPYIADSEPADIPHKIDINFENKIHLVGYKVEPEIAKPNSDIKITYYWRCDDTLDDGWALFTHVTDESIGKSDNLDWAGPLREKRDEKQLLSPSKWERGKYYIDEQPYKVPDWVKGPELTFYVGIWKGSARLHVVAGPNDGENRAIVAKVKTGMAAPPPQEIHSALPDVSLGNKLAANDKITIDGKADEAAWKGAAVLGPFVDQGTGAANASFPVNGKVRLLWDDQNLYIFGELTEKDVTGGFDDKTKKVPAKDDKTDSVWTTGGQPKLWTKDALEVMIDPGPSGDNKNYFELQFNPQNKVFHSQFDDFRNPSTEPNGPFGHEDWDPKLKSAVQVHGTLDKPGDEDQGWDVEIAIPWTAFAKNSAKAPPAAGDEWRMNFYAMHQNNAVGWSATLGQGFHRAARFGHVHFGPPAPAGVSGAPAASGSGATPPPPPAMGSGMPVPHFRTRMPGMRPQGTPVTPP
jgi:hypothetical protein